MRCNALENLYNQNSPVSKLTPRRWEFAGQSRLSRVFTTSEFFLVANLLLLFVMFITGDLFSNMNDSIHIYTKLKSFLGEVQ
jgi:hypothetical protein